MLNRCWGLELRAPVCTLNSFLLLHCRKAWSSMGSTARSRQPRRRRRPLTSPHRPTAEPAPKAANLTGKGAGNARYREPPSPGPRRRPSSARCPPDLRALDGRGIVAPRRRWDVDHGRGAGGGCRRRVLPLPAAAAARPALPAPPGLRGVAGGVPAARARSRRTPPHKSGGGAALRLLGSARLGAAPTAV